MRRNFHEPDGGLNCFDLAEERTLIAESMLSPVLEQPLCLRCHLPLMRMQTAPSVHMPTHFIDNRSGLVVLLQ